MPMRVGDLDFSGAKAVVSDPQAGIGRGQVAAVVAGASDAEGFGQTAGATGESRSDARGPAGSESSRARAISSMPEKGFKGAEENAPAFAFALTGDVQTVMVAVDEINVGVARRSEEDRIAGGVAGGGVGGGVVLSEISFDFDDAGGEARAGRRRGRGFPRSSRATRRGSRAKKARGSGLRVMRPGFFVGGCHRGAEAPLFHGVNTSRFLPPFSTVCLSGVLFSGARTRLLLYALAIRLGRAFADSFR